MFGQAFIELFKDYPDVERFAICDLRKDRVEYWAKKYGICETYSSLDDICRSDIESLAIITQPWLHAQQAIKAMKAGKHVYCAVPAAQSIKECNDLVKTVKETGMIYMNGETSYFRPEAVFCRRKAGERIGGRDKTGGNTDALPNTFNLLSSLGDEGAYDKGFRTGICISQ